MIKLVRHYAAERQTERALFIALLRKPQRFPDFVALHVAIGKHVSAVDECRGDGNVPFSSARHWKLEPALAVELHYHHVGEGFSAPILLENTPVELVAR